MLRTQDDLKAITTDLLEQLLPQERAFHVRLWDGTLLPAREARATLVLSREDALGRVLDPPIDLAAGEAFIRGDIDVEGDLEVVIQAIEAINLRLGPLGWLRLLRGAARLRRQAEKAPLPFLAQLSGRKHSQVRDQQAVQHHYDVSNRFYELMLDPRLVYSCAYFPRDTESLEEAQLAKLDLVCRKLRLKPGECFLDIGAGWGGLVIHAAEHYGVKAHGITLSNAQLAEAQARVKAAGLEQRVTLELKDYRELQGEFDKIASVGMAEHVGQEKLARYFRSAFARLKPGGLMLNHAISGGPRGTQISSRLVSGELTRRYIFPDGDILPLSKTVRAAERAGFEVRDVEDLREHYARTLRCWAQNLDAHWDEAVAEVGLELARLRRLHLSAAAFQFAYAHVAIHQTLLAKPDAQGRVDLPPSRADLYS